MRPYQRRLDRAQVVGKSDVGSRFLAFLGLAVLRQRHERGICGVADAARPSRDLAVMVAPRLGPASSGSVGFGMSSVRSPG